MLRSHLSVQLQLSSASSTGVNGEFSWFVDDAAQWFQAWARTLDLRRRKKPSEGTICQDGPHTCGWPQPHILWECIIGCWKDMGHEGTVLDVLVVTYDVHGVVARFSGPVANIT